MLLYLLLYLDIHLYLFERSGVESNLELWGIGPKNPKLPLPRWVPQFTGIWVGVGKTGISGVGVKIVSISPFPQILKWGNP